MLDNIYRRKSVLYAIQGTGNGHISRAKEIVPMLKKYADVDLLISGSQNEIDWEEKVRYTFKGLGFAFGKRGGVDWFATLKQMNIFTFCREVSMLNVAKYDVVISDFEPVSAWACKLANVPCIALSHQSALLDSNTPMALKRDWVGQMILKHYAPCRFRYSFHFESYGEGIYTPVIRKEIREMNSTSGGPITVYLPSYSDEWLLAYLEQFDSCNWEIYSKRSTEVYQVKNCKVVPINGKAFGESMARSSGVLCGAGFETPAEALYLGKKLLVVPMSGQYEQQCNAAALNAMGIPVVGVLDSTVITKVQQWIDQPEALKITYPDVTESIIKKVLYATLDNESSMLQAADDWLFAQ